MWETMVRYSLTIVPIGVGITYLLGLILVNSHLARYGILDFAMVRARYLAAGLLYVAITSIPVTVGVLFWREWNSVGPEAGFVGVLVPIAVTLGVGTLLWHGVLNLLLIRPRFHVEAYESLYFLGVIALSAHSAFTLPHLLPSNGTEIHLGHVLSIVTRFILLLASIFFFSRFFFRELKPELGGGGVWVARVYPDTSLIGELRECLEQEVWVLDRNPGVIRVLRKLDPDALGLEISTALIQAMEIRGALPLSRKAEPQKPPDSHGPASTPGEKRVLDIECDSTG